MEREYDAARVKQILEIKAQTYFGVPLAEASKTQVYKAVCMTVRDILTEMRLEFKRKRKEQKTKQVYYMSMEFLQSSPTRVSATAASADWRRRIWSR